MDKEKLHMVKISLKKSFWTLVQCFSVKKFSLSDLDGLD